MNCQDQPKVEQKQEPIENLPVKPPKVEKPFTANDPEGKEITWNKDGAQMVLIPAGSFRMGANDPEDWMNNEGRKLAIKAFCQKFALTDPLSENEFTGTIQDLDDSTALGELIYKPLPKSLYMTSPMYICTVVRGLRPEKTHLH